MNENNIDIKEIKKDSVIMDKPLAWRKLLSDELNKIIHATEVFQSTPDGNVDELLAKISISSLECLKLVDLIFLDVEKRLICLEIKQDKMFDYVSTGGKANG